jgi:hypothetical protein
MSEYELPPKPGIVVQYHAIPTQPFTTRLALFLLVIIELAAVGAIAAIVLFVLNLPQHG